MRQPALTPRQAYNRGARARERRHGIAAHDKPAQRVIDSGLLDYWQAGASGLPFSEVKS